MSDNAHYADMVCGGQNLAVDENGNEYCLAAPEIAAQYGPEDMCYECYQCCDWEDDDWDDGQYYDDRYLGFGE